MTARLLHPLFALLASVSRQELARQVAYLKEENRILRARLPERIVTTSAERRRLVRAGRKLGLQLRELISIVSYQTFRRWVREQEAQKEAQARKPTKEDASTRELGRPRTPEEIRELILRIRKESSSATPGFSASCGNSAFMSHAR